MSRALDPAEWQPLFTAAAAASAALLGLLFVAVTLRLREIENDPPLLLRARVNLQGSPLC